MVKLKRWKNRQTESFTCNSADNHLLFDCIYHSHEKPKHKEFFMYNTINTVCILEKINKVCVTDGTVGYQC